MNQQEVEQWIAANGGASGLQYNSSTRRVRNPARMMTNADGSDNPSYDPTAPEWIDVAEESWTNSKTGATLRVSRRPDNAFDVIENKNADPNKPTPQGTKEWRTEGTPDGQGGFDNSRPIMAAYVNGQRTGETRQPTGDELRDWRIAQQGGKTDAEIRAERDAQQAQQPSSVRVPVEGHPGIYLVTRKNPQTGQTDTIYENEAGQKVPQPAAAPSYSVTQRTINGQTFTIITKTPKDGSPPTIMNYGPDGKPVSALPTEGVGNIPGLPTYVPDLTKPGAGLFEYAKQLDEFMKANPSFTWEKRQQVLEAAQKQAATVVSEFNTGAAILREQYQMSVTQRGQDMTQANNRAALANTHHQNAIGLIEKFAPYLGVTSGDAGKLFLGMMASQLATATAYGGMQNYGREEMDPRLLSFADRAVGGASRPVSPTPPGTPPNAIGLGGPGAVFTPQGWTPPPANPDAAMAEAVRQQRAASGAPQPAPALGPQPAAVSMDATDPAQQGQPAFTPVAPPTHTQAAPIPMAPPVQGAPNEFGQIGEPMLPPVVNPATGEPTGLPQTPYAPPNATPVPIPDPYATPSPAQSMVPPGLEAMFANVLPPEPVSWHERAQAQASAFEQPANVGRMESLIGSAIPTGPMFGRFNLGGPVGQAPLPLASRIPGLTPEADAEAKRQLAMGV